MPTGRPRSRRASGTARLPDPPERAIAATEDAATIYHTVNVPYHLQNESMPGIGRAVLTAAVRNDARLVVLDTLHPYGEADGAAITEDTPWAATSR